MLHNTTLANRLRDYLSQFPTLKVEEKNMFRGLTFMVNGKMCISVSRDNLMCRFDPLLQEIVAEKREFLPMIVRGKLLKGYCYVYPTGYQSKSDFEYWVNLCLDYNEEAKSSKKGK